MLSPGNVPRGAAAKARESIESLNDAVREAERSGQHGALAETLRQLAIALHESGERAEARRLCTRSCDVAKALGSAVLTASALNSLGVMELMSGSLVDARQTLLEALDVGGGSRALAARVEQNLGIVANIQGEYDEALLRYKRSHDAFESDGNDHGCALTEHNLGMTCFDRGRYAEAAQHFIRSRVTASRVGDAHLEALCLVNEAEVDIALQRYENARQSAEQALAVFAKLGERRGKADAYRVIGMVYRETGRPALAESRLRAAIELATSCDAPLIEAEAGRELAVLYQATGRNPDALRAMYRAHRLFHRLDARADLVNVGGKVAALEATYMLIVRTWGESIESADPLTHGHCERVAGNAIALSRELKLDEQEETTIFVGAYLHDLGKLCLAHETLTERESLTPEDIAQLRRHPLLGITLLADVEFPWDVKPIIRWHHERYDGTGYPDGLAGDEIPLGAQIVGILDTYDGLITARRGCDAPSPAEAFERIRMDRHWWSPAVFEAFAKVVGPRR